MPTIRPIRSAMRPAPPWKEPSAGAAKRADHPGRAVDPRISSRCTPGAHEPTQRIRSPSPAMRRSPRIGALVQAPLPGHVAQVPAQHAERFPVQPVLAPACLGGLVVARAGDRLREIPDPPELRQPPPEVIVQADVERLVEAADGLPRPAGDQAGGLADDARASERPSAERARREAADGVARRVDDVGLAEHGDTIRTRVEM